MNRALTTVTTPAVWLGVAGSAMVAWGSVNDEFSFSAHGWPSALAKALASTAPLPLDRILIVLGALALTASWWLVRPRHGVEPVHAGWTLAAWAAPLLLAPPILSPDAALYADLGWIQLQGLNPYEVGLGGAGGPYADQVDPLWAGQGVAYPPLALLVKAAVVALVGAHPWWGIVAMRLPALVAVIAIGLLLPRIADQLGRPRRTALWMGLMNPLLVLHLIGGAHNDGPMIALSLLAIHLTLRYRTNWMSLAVGPVLIGIAMAFKQQGGLTVIAVAGLPVAAQLAALDLPRRLWLLGWRTLVASVVTVSTFLAICLASGLGLGWLEWLDLMGKASTPAPLAMIPKAIGWLLRWGGTDPTGFLVVAGALGTGLLLVVLGWIGIRFSDRPLSALAWGSLAIAVLGQALHPWYLPWSLALLALVRLTRRQRRLVYGLSVGFTLWNALQTAIWHGQAGW